MKVTVKLALADGHKATMVLNTGVRRYSSRDRRRMSRLMRISVKRTRAALEPFKGALLTSETMRCLKETVLAERDAVYARYMHLYAYPRI